MTKEEFIGIIAMIATILFLAAILAITIERPEVKHPLDDKWKD